MSKKAPIRKLPVAKPILEEESEELHEERRAKIDNLIIQVDDHLKANENNMIDNGTMGSLNDMYQTAVKWSNVLNWLSQVKANRYIIPETAARIQEEQKKNKLSAEDQKRMEENKAEIEKGGIIV